MPLPVIAGALNAAGRIAGSFGGSAVRGFATAVPGAVGTGNGARPIAREAGSGVINSVQNSLNSLSQNFFNLQQITSGIQQLGGAIAGLPTAPIDAFAKAVVLIQTPITAAIGSLKQFQTAIGAMGLAVAEFVRLASPVDVQKFNLAMDDFAGVFGRILIPVMRVSTAVVRLFADTAQAVSGPLGKIVSAFFTPLEKAIPKLAEAARPLQAAFERNGPLFERLAKTLSDIAIQALTGSFDTLIKTVVSLTDALAPMIAAMNSTLEVTRAMGETFPTLFRNSFSAFEDFKKLNGFGPAVKDDKRKLEGGSVGAAVRPAQFQSIEDYGKRAQQAAFSLGKEGAKPEDKTAAATVSLNEYFTGGKFLRDLKDMLASIADLPEKAKNAITESETFQDAERFAKDKWDRLNEYFK